MLKQLQIAQLGQKRKEVVMALEKIFFDPRALKCFGEGPLASKLDGFCECLSKRGFARSTMRSFYGEKLC